MITPTEVRELSALTFETLVYELLELIKNDFAVKSGVADVKYSQSKFVVLDGLIKKKLTQPFETD